MEDALILSVFGSGWTMGLVGQGTGNRLINSAVSFGLAADSELGKREFFEKAM